MSYFIIKVEVSGGVNCGPASNEGDFSVEVVAREKYLQLIVRWTRQGQCVGACPANSGCDSGFCVCAQEDGWTQIHGRCEWNSTAVFLGADHKYRKPRPPPKPRACFCKKRNSNSEEVCPHQRDNPACADVHYPNVFDHNSQFCS